LSRTGEVTVPSPVYRLNPVVAIEDFGDRSLALHCDDLRLVELNATARDLVSRLNGGTSLAEAAAAMAGEYGQPLEMVLADVESIVNRMVELDVLEPATGTADTDPVRGP
jgi:hypothetical protein